MSSVNAWTAALALVWAALTAGCVSHYPDLESVGAGTKAPPGVELQDVPFFPQDEFQCGPAALATVLVDSGVAVTPDELTDKVYLPEREGSLQLELIAASRRYERLPYVLDGTLAAILAELAAGRPVLVPSALAALTGRAGESTLSPREAEVLRLVAQGLTNGAIASRLLISESTVKTHLLHVYAKLEVADRASAVRVAWERDLV